MIRNLLPQDTRSSELASAGAMLALALSMLAGMPTTEHMADLHPPAFWAMLAACLGTVQFVTLAAYPILETLRCWVALINGSMWVWLGLSSLLGHPSPSDWGMLFLGVSNLYGFSVTFLFLRKSWEN